MINRVILVGRLTDTPELKTTNSGMSVCSFTIAVDDRKRNPDGTKNTNFFNCTVFQQQADNLTKFLRKGALVGVDGRLSQRRFTRKDGTKGSVVEIMCDSVQFLEPKSKGESEEAVSFESDIPEQDDSNKNLDTLDLPGDDLPF